MIMFILRESDRIHQKFSSFLFQKHGTNRSSYFRINTLSSSSLLTLIELSYPILNRKNTLSMSRYKVGVKKKIVSV
jgi:hypothetical protein